jgi:uncharacterized protein (DUF1800 family)
MFVKIASVFLLVALGAAQTAPAPPANPLTATRRSAKSKSLAAKPAALTPEQRAAHALSRLTFGARPGDVQQVMQRGLDAWFEQQLNPEAIDDKALDARLGPLRTLRMAPRELVAKFPPQPMVRAVADGRQSMPDDPAVKMIYVAQIERYKQQQQAQRIQQEMQMKPDAQMKPAVANTASPDQQPDAENGMAAALLAERLLALPKDKRMAALEQMPPADLRLLANSLRPELRIRLLLEFSPEEREALLALANPNGVVTGELMQAKLLRAIYSQRQLQEVMTDFWFNHFNVFIFKDADQYLLTTYERDVIRPRALGRFQDLLVAVAHSPAMLFYLDNWLSVGPDSQAAQSVKRAATQGRPAPPVSGLNENYARELMELHTLGVNGGYSQQDVQEVAKVFTGWTIDAQPQFAGPWAGGFKFLPQRHQPGVKTVLGRQITEDGEQEGMQVLALLAHYPATAKFICTKLARRFVADDPPPSLVDRMAATFLSSDGDIREVLRTMFRSPEFWSPKYFRAKMKTPLEFVASAARSTGAELQNPQPVIGALGRMGMPLYGAQPPTGYSTFSEAWTNSDALLDRMNFAVQLTGGRMPGIQCDPAHTLAAAMFSMPAPSSPLPARATSRTRANVTASPADLPLKYLETVLLPGGVSAQTHQAILNRLAEPDISSTIQEDPTNALRNITGLLLGSPEFQQR